jgi:uncharacterized protein
VGTRPFLVGVTDLVRRLGTRRPVRRAAPLPGLAITTAALDPATDVVADLELESIANGVVARGTITARWTGSCRRCLDPVSGTVVVDLREIFQRDPVDGETYPLVDDILDLEPMVRDVLLGSLPLAPLCSEDCRGPDPDAFPTSVEGESDDAEDVTRSDGPPADPRWAALDQLKFD